MLTEAKQGVNSVQKLSPADARTQLLKRHQAKKLLETEMEQLKKTSEESKVKEYYSKLIKFHIIKAFEALNMNMRELDAIKFMESHPSKPPQPAPPPQASPQQEEVLSICHLLGQRNRGRGSEIGEEGEWRRSCASGHRNRKKMATPKRCFQARI